MQTTHRRACNLCEAICGLIIQVEDKKVVSIAGDKDDPLSKGYLCPKAFALKDIYEDPNRIKLPRKKKDGGWITISWAEALAEVVDRLTAIQKKYGKDAVGFYQGNPSVHNWGTYQNTGAFIKALGSKNIFSATSIDQLPHHFASWLMYGHPLLIPVPDLSRTNYMLILGGNPLASNGSLMTAPDVGGRLKEIRHRGGKVVVLDPRHTETAEKMTEHYFIRPGTDVYFLLAVVQTLFKENKVDLGLLAEFTDGLNLLKRSTAKFTPEAAERLCGVPAATIRQIALDFAGSSPAVCYGRMGVSTQQFGTLCNWLVNAINIITGNLDRAGGAMFTLPAVDFLANAKQRPIFGRWRSRVRLLPEFMGELPVSVLAEEVLAEGPGQIKAMITSCGNPILSTPNGKQLDEAFEKLEYLVCVDIYVNETTRHADLILPPAAGLEVSHYDLIFNALAVHNTAKYSPPVFEKLAGAKFDWEIWQELTYRLQETEQKPVVALEIESGQLGRTSEKQTGQENAKKNGAGEGNKFSPEPPEGKLDIGLKYGPYGLSLQALIETPQGVDCGPLRPCLPLRLAREPKRIDLAPEIMIKELDKALAIASEPEFIQSAYPFLLIGRRHLRDNNSWMHNSEKLMKGHNRCTIMMHPSDATKIKISANDVVKVTSRVGSVDIPVDVTSAIMPGVVSIPHGYGHRLPGVLLEVAGRYAGVSMNDLTDDQDVDAVTGNAVLNGIRVKIESYR